MSGPQNRTIRLTGTSYAVLSLLELHGPCSPYDLKQALENSIENFWPVPHTTFYAEPTRLAAAGLLSEQQEPGGRRRKLYELTAQGHSALREWTSSAGLAPPQLREEAVLKIFAGGDPVAIFTERRHWHREKLAELEGYLQALEDSSAAQLKWQGVHASLRVGVSYHRMLLEAIERFLDAQAATDSS